VTIPALNERYGDITAADVGRLDAAAAALGIDTERLMEHAGWQVARCATELCEPSSVIAIVAGSGNNGGDGVVAGRLLASWSYQVSIVVFAQPGKLAPAFSQRLNAAASCGATSEITRQVDAVAGLLDTCELAIDALLGSGMSGPPREDTAAVIELFTNVNTLSVDVPSGLDATTGPTAVCTDADVTCTLAAMKRGLWTTQGRARAGRILVADIGMPAAAWRACGLEPPSEIKNGLLVELNDLDRGA
jgi:ADP-dependent NAD(P)H-hydrate dehydratase / NAD(P)H-hydrate epimerase